MTSIHSTIQPVVNVATIRGWILEGEGERLEFKSTTGQREEAAKALCGMLNGAGGRVIFGITPDGAIAGQQVVDKTLEQIADVLGRIQPNVNPVIERVAIDEERAVIVVTVESGRLKPYMYRGSAYRRIGATTAKMTWDEHQNSVLEQAHPIRRWETEPSLLTIEDLDIPELLAQIEEGVRRRRFTDLTTREPSELLLRLRLLTDSREVSNAAAVLFGQPDRLAMHYPQCVVRLARFEGTVKTDRLADSRIVNNNAFGVIAAAETFLNEHLRIASRLRPDSFIREDTPEIPILAFREALANAVAHREYHQHSGTVMVAIYHDRIEITNTGQLHGVSVEELYEPHEPKPWNPSIAGIIYRTGVVDSSGSGTLRMIDLCREARLPAPVITESAGSVWVTFTRPGHTSPLLKEFDLSDYQLKVLSAVAIHAPATRGDLVSTTGIAERTVRSALDRLRHENLVELLGERKAGRWHLAGAARRAYGLPGRSV